MNRGINAEESDSFKSLFICTSTSKDIDTCCYDEACDDETAALADAGDDGPGTSSDRSRAGTASADSRSDHCSNHIPAIPARRIAPGVETENPRYVAARVSFEPPPRSFRSMR